MTEVEGAGTVEGVVVMGRGGGGGGVGVVYFTTPPEGLHGVSARYSALGVRAQG